MPATIAYDPTANIFTLEADNGEIFIGVGPTHAIKVLEKPPFALSHSQARDAMLQAFSRIGAPWDIGISKKMAAVAADITRLASESTAYRQIPDGEVKDQMFSQGVSKLKSAIDDAKQATEAVSTNVEGSISEMTAENKARVIKTLNGMVEVVEALSSAISEIA